MSRSYEVQVVIDKKVTKDDVEKFRNVLSAEGLDVTFSDCFDDAVREPYVQIEGTVSLVAGESEEQAHRRICKAIKKVRSDCLVKTAWLYLDDLPWEDYGPD